MKRMVLTFTLISFLFSCNQEGKKNAGDADSSNPASPSITDSINTKKDGLAEQADTSLLDTSRVILAILKEQDFEKLAQYIHPSWGLRFSPYAYSDTTKDQVLTPYQLKMAAQKSSRLLWGSYDGTGNPIRMNIKEYFKKFVYNKDYLNAPQTSVNKFLGGGNSVNNLKSVYPNADFTEFYFPGFEKKYDGMDWQTLRLLFRQQNGRLYLIAIIHDQWTI